MRYWKVLNENTENERSVYVEGSEIDYLLDRIFDLHKRKDEVNEEYYNKTLSTLIFKLANACIGE